MGEFAIRSNRRSDQLVLWTAKPRGQWCARIDFGDLVAEAKVCGRSSGDALHLDAYFAGLANQWRGWTGTTEWESLGLRLDARHDGLGHVTLEATLDQDYAMPDRWSVHASLVLDAGSLGTLARAARVLDEA
jgi:uncharacterized protein DUF6228